MNSQSHPGSNFLDGIGECHVALNVGVKWFQTALEVSNFTPLSAQEIISNHCSALLPVPFYPIQGASAEQIIMEQVEDGEVVPARAAHTEEEEEEEEVGDEDEGESAGTFLFFVSLSAGRNVWCAPQGCVRALLHRTPRRSLW